MGLDLALGGLVLLAAIRGWLKGFLVQSIRLGGLVGSVYAAGPIRDQVKPYLAGQFPSMRPELLDRLLWWTSGVGAYFALVGVASLIVAVSRRQTFGMAEPNRGDQFAGFGLGVIKGLLLAAFVVAGLHRYAEPQIAQIAWAVEQKKESYAWQWNERYHPAARVWAAPPVQNFVHHIQKMGLMTTPGLAPARPDPSAETAVQTASRAPKLTIPVDRPDATPMDDPRLPLGRTKRSELDTTGLDPEIAATVESILSRLPASGDTPDR